MTDSDKSAKSTKIDVVSEAAIAVATGIPPQMQRSFFKAVNRVFSAGAEIPAQWLEDRAKIGRAKREVEIARHVADAAEIRSRQDARHLINAESAKSAALKFSQNDDIAGRALEYHAAHILREQQIREDVLSIAAEVLKSSSSDPDSAADIDDDWLNFFFREASTRSADEFKCMFGRILAGEVRQPGTFSIATLQSLSRLTAETAKAFQDLCNVSSSGIFNAKVIADPFGGAGDNSLEEFGLAYLSLARLVEDGLIRPEFEEWQKIPAIFFNSPFIFEHAGLKLLLTPSQDPSLVNVPDVKITGPAFTKAGEELRRIVTMVPSDVYLRRLAEWFGTQGLVLNRVSKIEGGRVHFAPV